MKIVHWKSLNYNRMLKTCHQKMYSYFVLHFNGKYWNHFIERNVFFPTQFNRLYSEEKKIKWFPFHLWTERFWLSTNTNKFCFIHEKRKTILTIKWKMHWQQILESCEFNLDFTYNIEKLFQCHWDQLNHIFYLFSEKNYLCVLCMWNVDK